MSDDPFCPVYVEHNWGNETTYVRLPDRPGKKPGHYDDLAIDRPCRLTLRWPDGTVESVDVEIRIKSQTVYEQGGSIGGYTVRSACPVVVRAVHGKSVTVPLSGVHVDPSSVEWQDMPTALAAFDVTGNHKKNRA